MSFTAKYRGDCRDCDDPILLGQQVEFDDDPILLGQQVEFDDDRYLLHVLCPQSTVRGKPRPICPRCFCEIPVSGVCGTCGPD